MNLPYKPTAVHIDINRKHRIEIHEKTFQFESWNQKKFDDLMMKNQPYAMKICSISPQNKIHDILNYFVIAQNIAVVIIGNWQKSDYGKQLQQLYSACNNIYLFDMIYDIEMLDKIRENAAFYVHDFEADGTLITGSPSLT